MVSQLQYAVSGQDRQIVVNGVDSSIIDMLTAGGHGFFTLYNAGAREQVLVTSYAAPYFNLRRDEDAGAWPVGTFVTVDEISPLPLPPNFESQLNQLLLRIQVGPSLVRSFPQPYLVQIDMPTTGVTPGTYGGMQIDAYGRITAIPNNWPANALPTFASGDTDPSDGTDTADIVGYTPQIGGTIALAANVQAAMYQLEDAIFALQGGTDTFVQQVLAGGGVSIGGTTSQPVVSLPATGITPGEYNGFTIDQYGRVTAFEDVAPAGFPTLQATLPLTIAFASTTDTYTFGVNNADSSNFGVVKKADQALIAADTVSDTTTVPDFLGVTTAIDLRTAKNAAAATDIAVGDKIAFYDISASKMVATTIGALLSSSTFVAGTVGVSGGVATLAHGNGITSVSRTAAGIVRITLTTAEANTTYHVDVTQLGTSASLFHSVNIISTTVFDIYFNNTGGTATDPTGFSLLVVAA